MQGLALCAEVLANFPELAGHRRTPERELMPIFRLWLDLGVRGM